MESLLTNTSSIEILFYSNPLLVIERKVGQSRTD